MDRYHSISETLQRNGIKPTTLQNVSTNSLSQKDNKISQKKSRKMRIETNWKILCEGFCLNRMIAKISSKYLNFKWKCEKKIIVQTIFLWSLISLLSADYQLIKFAHINYQRSNARFSYFLNVIFLFNQVKRIILSFICGGYIRLSMTSLQVQYQYNINFYKFFALSFIQKYQKLAAKKHIISEFMQ